MEFAEALEIVIARTTHTRYRALCDSAHPDSAAYRTLVLRLAEPPAARLQPGWPPWLALPVITPEVDGPRGCGCGAHA